MRKRLGFGLLIFCIWLGGQGFTAQSAGSGSAQILLIDVGQGDAALLQDPDGFDVLIDGGPTQAGAAVVGYLRGHTDKTIDVILISHPHEDHIGGLLAVLQASDLVVGQILYNGYPGATQTWANLMALASARAIPLTVIQFPAEVHWGRLNAYILNPAPGLSNPAANEASMVVRIDYDRTRFLFPGDIGQSTEATVVARATPVQADVLKVAHHGSAYSTSSAFLAAVQPTLAVISVGASNSYGHPAPNTLARLAVAGVRVWRTDRSGTLLLTSDGATVTFPPLPFAIKIFVPVALHLAAQTP